MQKMIQPEADAFLAKKRRRRLWTRLVSVLGCVVVFCTTYALILPAITAEKTVCGFEEHTHSDECYSPLPAGAQTVLSCTYETLGVHSHTEDCYDADGQLICGLADYVAHTHDENCYDAEGVLVCTLPENPGHVHTEACYAPAEEGHAHTDACYEMQQGELICGLEENEEHQHSADCYEQQKVLVCPLAEQAPVPPELICGQPETITHQHTDSCFETVEPVRELICQLPEHTHTEDCYEKLTAGDPSADLETAADWEASLSGVVLTGDYRADLVAIAQSQLGYRESTENFILDESGLVKGYTRYGEWFGITHGDWCAMFVSFCLRYAEIPNFPFHSRCNAWIEVLRSEDYGLYRPAGDYEPQPGDVVFFDLDGDKAAEHVGIVAELIEATETEPARLRTIEGNAGDAVRSITYEADSDLILGFGVLPEKEAGYSCEKVSHLHTDYCYNTSPGGRLLCPFEEHSHDESCIPEPMPEEELMTLSFSGEDFTVTVQYGSEAALPEGVILTVREIPADSEEYRTYCDQSLFALAEGENTDTLIFARFFDISFVLDGEIIEPEAPVSVTITYADAVETGEEANCQAIHFAAEGPELLQVETEALEDGGTSFTHTQDGFSVVGDLITASYVNQNPADNGPNSLPVDYYVCIDGVWTCVGSTKTGWYNNWNGTDAWTEYNRDYITVEQAVSILGNYGFTGAEANPSLITAYQQKSGNANIYSDTNTVSFPEGDENGVKILPLSRNTDHAGYNLYYLPGNTSSFGGVASPEKLDKAANGFYTVKVFDSQGELLTSDLVQTGGNFTYNSDEPDTTVWLLAYGSGSTGALTGSTITINNITSAVIVSPQPEGTAAAHRVSFKVMIDGQWQTVGSLPYYYTGEVGGSQRAYITSAMAAQFFGDYGYTATTAPGYQFGYSYNDIYTIYYANSSTQTNFCMDIDGGKLKDAQAVQLYKSNGTDAQVFRVWDAGNGYSFITPIGNSSLHVNVYGYSEANPSSTQLKLSSAADANSQWRVDTGADGRTTFWSAIAPNTKVIDLSGGSMSNGGVLQMYDSTGGAHYWYMVQQYRIANNTVSAQNVDGTYNIGLTPESNGDIVCYYLPAETGSKYAKTAESEIDTANSFWSVSVRDDTHSIYSEGELSGMVQIVPQGGSAVVEVKNADGILWSCRGTEGKPVVAESNADGDNTTFIISNISQPIEITATKANPSFTIQYYAWMDMAADSGAVALNIIDTSGAKLPGNYSTWTKYKEQTAPAPASLLQIFLTDNGKLSTVQKLLEVYASQDYEFVKAPDLAYVNKLEDNSHYLLKELWVLKSGCDPKSTNAEDWSVYSPEAAFVNRVPSGVNEIMVTDDTVIRLVFEESSGTYNNAVNFYDYDITDGSRVEKYDSKHSMYYVVTQTSQYGINSSINYSGSGTKLAFGNRNTGMGLQDQLWGTNYLNHLNASLPANDPGYGLNLDEMRGYMGCSFGLVTSLKSDGTIQYSNGVDAPKLFNESAAVQGKTAFDNGQYSLEFSRTGDTYTLSSVVGTNAVNLDQFNHELNSNNFWPMDSAPTWGADGHDLKFGSSAQTYARRYNSGSYYSSLPVSDDGQDHNSYFGMQYAVNFNLTEDYVGPLEYYFYGDDDMWVFLDSQLVCDIGGVHSTVGEYVNLWDYLEKGKSGSHTLTFFYTERGASGSTCYMRFTLPSVSNATLSKYHGDLNISKNVSIDGYEDYTYQFKVDLLTREGGSSISQTCRYIITSADGTVVYKTLKSGDIISLKPQQSATISGIPAGTYYCVTEQTTQGYQTTVNGNAGYIVAGIIANGKIQSASFVNTPSYELPQTGGAGTQAYIMGGLLFMSLSASLLFYIHLKRRKEETGKSS